MGPFCFAANWKLSCVPSPPAPAGATAGVAQGKVATPAPHPGFLRKFALPVWDQHLGIVIQQRYHDNTTQAVRHGKPQYCQVGTRGVHDQSGQRRRDEVPHQRSRSLPPVHGTHRAIPVILAVYDQVACPFTSESYPEADREQVEQPGLRRTEHYDRHGQSLDGKAHSHHPASAIDLGQHRSTETADDAY